MAWYKQYEKSYVDGKEELRGGQLSEASYMSAFRLGTYIATQFKPNVQDYLPIN